MEEIIQVTFNDDQDGEILGEFKRRTVKVNPKTKLQPRFGETWNCKVIDQIKNVILAEPLNKAVDTEGWNFGECRMVVTEYLWEEPKFYWEILNASGQRIGFVDKFGQGIFGSLPFETTKAEQRPTRSLIIALKKNRMIFD